MAGMTDNTPRRRELTLDEYYAGVRDCDITILAPRADVDRIQPSGPPRQAEALLTRLLPHTGQAIRVGITGAPGVGKSTFIEALGLHLVRSGQRDCGAGRGPVQRH